VEAPKAAYVKRTYSPELPGRARSLVMARVREEGAKRIKRSVERAIAMGMLDKTATASKKNSPPICSRGRTGTLGDSGCRSCTWWLGRQAVERRAHFPEADFGFAISSMRTTMLLNSTVFLTGHSQVLARQWPPSSKYRFYLNLYVSDWSFTGVQ